MDAVLNWVWQGSVVAVASFVMLLALERARANVRYIVCWAALFVVVALPALPSLQLTAVSTEALRAPHGDAMVSLPDTWWTSALVVLAAWVVWASVHLVRFVAAIATIRRARAHSHPFPLNVESKLSHWVRVSSTRRRATLVVSESVTAAAVLGWGTPMIAVSPSVVKTLDADELDRILIHEWAHVQRRDDLVNIVQIAVRSIVGWHPALWWIGRRLHVEREIACDEMTVAITGSPKTYAECLMKLASLRTTPRTMRAAPAVLTSSGLRARIIKIVSVHPSIAPLWSRSIAVAIVTVLCLMATGLGGLKLVEATVLALPIVSSQTLSSTVHRISSIAVPILSSDVKTDRSLRTKSGVSPAQHPQTQQIPGPPPKIDSGEAVTPEGSHAPDSAAPTQANPEPTVIPTLATVPEMSPPERADTKAERPRAPWTAAADGGAAIGRKSKDAGLATAGFFTRFARRVAGSF
jgi:beta-lactamase regulating signal transducer with metallopeptidase domain